MKILSIILFCTFAFPCCSVAANDPLNKDVDVRVYLEPDDKIYIGQLVRLWVEITTSTAFSRAPHYPDLQVEGAVSVMPEQLGVNFSENDAGNTRIGQRQRYAIIPQRGGRLSIPSLNITLGIQVNGRPSDIITLRTNPSTINVAIPPGAENIKQLVSTKKLTVKELYSGNTEQLKIGDAVTREITITADDMLAAALPAITFKDVKSTKLYPAQPILKDTINRGNYSATRTDSTTYVLEKEGEVELPEVVISWWNLESKELEKTKLPAVSFNVAPNPEHKTTTHLNSNNGDPVVTLKRALLDALTWLRNNIVKITISAIVVYLFYLACHRYSPPLIRKTQGYLKLARESEFVAYLKLCKNLWMKNKDKTVPSFWKWLDCVTPGNQSASLELLARKVKDLEFNALAKSLTANRYNVDKTARPITTDFHRKMARFRKKLFVRDIETGTGSEKKLNPQR